MKTSAYARMGALLGGLALGTGIGSLPLPLGAGCLVDCPKNPPPEHLPEGTYWALPSSIAPALGTTAVEIELADDQVIVRYNEASGAPVRIEYERVIPAE